MGLSLPAGMQITGAIAPGFDRILSPAALAFVARLHREFEPLFGATSVYGDPAAIGARGVAPARP